MKIIAWIKNNKLTTLLILVVLFLLFKKFSQRGIVPLTTDFISPGISSDEGVELGMPAQKFGQGLSRQIAPDYYPQPEYPPQADITDRKVITDSQLSLQVKEVRTAVDDISEFAVRQGGYMVNTSVSNPGEAPSGNITIRVPQTKLNETLSYLRNLSIKVVWENLSGTDVTDEYVDLDARIATLNQTKAKFEEIFTRATEISDILNIQREIINLQSQIDSYKGQQNYLDKSAQLTKITVYLSTDEFSLPYAPSESWRPEVIIKQAVRSLVVQLRKVGTWIIWLTVFSVVWVPVLLIIFYFKKRITAKR